MLFKPATRTKSKLRMAIDGVSGSGKTFTALRFAFTLGKRVAVINSESGAIQKYLGLAPDGVPWNFDICELGNFAPTSYTAAILAAGVEGFDCLVIDSLSHAWAGEGGALELKDKVGDKNSFTAWKTITPMHNRMIEAILRSPCHVIATMRSKTEYALEPGANGKLQPRKLGLAPIQRAGMEYEFDLYATMDSDNFLTITKTRCHHPSFAMGSCVPKPDSNWFAPVVDWLNDGLDIPADAFAVTEADLAKFEARNAPAASANNANNGAGARPASVADMLKAAPVVETAAPAPAAANSGSPSLVETSAADPARANFATPPQREKIFALFNALNQTELQIQNILKKRAVQNVADLTIEQAAELIAKLESLLPKPAEVLGESTTGVGVQVVATTDRCTPIQLGKIESLLTEIEQTSIGVTKQVVDRLRAEGRNLVNELTIEEAQGLITALEKRELEEWFKVPF